MRDLLQLPEIPPKPRTLATTQLLDSGLAVATLDGLMDTVGQYVDTACLAGGTAAVACNLEEKLACYARQEVPVLFDGVITARAMKLGRLEHLLAWLEARGVCDVGLELAPDVGAAERARYVKELSANIRVVTSVTGPQRAPQDVARVAEADLAAGASQVAVAGTLLDLEHGCAVPERVIGECGGERVMFAVDRKPEHVALLRRFGPSVNLAGVPRQEIMSVATLRLGLRSDTVDCSWNACNGADKEPLEGEGPTQRLVGT